MENSKSNSNSSSPSKREGLKLSGSTLSKKKDNPQLGSLSDRNIQLSPVHIKKITIQGLTNYLVALADNIYASDPLSIRQLLLDFLTHDLPKLRHRLQQRLSLLKYLCESLKYKQFAEIDHEVQKEWRRNILLLSINTIWVTKMQSHNFESSLEFVQEYHKHISIVANLTHFYFREALILLKGNQFPTFGFLQDQTAHHIVNSLVDWEDLYHSRLIPLLKKQNLYQNKEPNLQFDLSTIQINKKYLDMSQHNLQLPETTRKIRQFSEQHTILCKIKRLKEIRQTFLQEIDSSRRKLEQMHNYKDHSPLQKDDIIDCMIYCIVRGQLTHLRASLQALSLLTGPANQILSRKGVDSYRADLQSAIQYLAQQNQQEMIMVPKEIKLFS